MADDVVGLDPPGLQGRQHGKACRNERRLLDGGIDELVLTSLEAKMPKVETGRLATDLVDLHRLGERLGDLAAHTGLQRALPRKTERDRTLHLTTSSRWPSIRSNPSPTSGLHPSRSSGQARRPAAAHRPAHLRAQAESTLMKCCRSARR